jgi:hypothetical protein
MFKLVLDERARTRPEAAKAKPEQFFEIEEELTGIERGLIEKAW